MEAERCERKKGGDDVIKGIADKRFKRQRFFRALFCYFKIREDFVGIFHKEKTLIIGFVDY
jgi:hypothetical protein